MDRPEVLRVTDPRSKDRCKARAAGEWTGPLGVLLFAWLLGVVPSGFGAQTRALRVPDVTVVGAQEIALPVQLIAVGEENALGFSLGFDPALLSYRGESPGAGAVGVALYVNTNALGAGRVGYGLAKPAGQRFSAGTNELLVLRFLAGTAVTNAALAFGDSPVVRETVDAAAHLLPTAYSNGLVTITPLFLPAIVTHPTNRTVYAGATVTFSVLASGSAPLLYQWQFNGANLAGATNPSLPLSSVATNQSGDFRVVVANFGGSVTSQVATLTVLPALLPPAVVLPPQSQVASAGEAVVFAVAATGSPPLRYQWKFNNNNLAGETNRTLLLTNLTTARSGNYSVQVSNEAGSTTSANASLAISATPRLVRALNRSVATGGEVEVPVELVGLGDENAVGFSLVFDPARLVYREARLGGSLVGVALLLNTNEVAAGRLGVGLTRQGGERFPAGVSVLLQVEFQAGDLAEPAVVDFGDAPVRRELADVLGNPRLVAFSSGAVTVLSTAPAVVTDPQSQTVPIFSPATFTVLAGGSVPLTYQWQFNGVNLAGATSRTLVLPSAHPTNAGGYRAIVTNLVGAATSSVATLTVPRVVRAPNTSVATGNEFDLPVQLLAAGDENAAGLSLRFDVARLGFREALSNSAPAGATLNANTNLAPSGGLGLGVAYPAGQSFTHGTQQVAVVRFLAGTTPGTSALTFGDTPVWRELVNEAAEPLEVIYQSGTVTGLLVRPVITRQPAGTNVVTGADVWLEAEASGSRPLSWQWQRNGVNISGATNATLRLSRVEISASGSYSVGAANAAGSTNSALALVTVRPPPADLAAFGLLAPAQVTAGQSVNLAWGVTNVGTSTAIGPWQETVYLADNPDGTGRRAVGTFTLSGSLEAGQGAARAQTVVVPADVGGVKYFAVVVDSGNWLVEPDEANNLAVAASATEVLNADLAVSLLRTAAAQFGQTAEVTWAVRNLGAGPANASWSDRLYLSTRSNSVAGATVLHTAPALATLVPGAAYTNTQAVLPPLEADLPPGNYFLIAVTDDGRAQPESDEDNNLRALPVSLAYPPLPDLKVENLSVSGPDANFTYTITWGTANRGAAPTPGGFWERLFVRNLTSGLILTNLESLSAGSLAVNATLARQARATATQPGTYRVEVTADARNEVFEFDGASHAGAESNTAAATFTIAQLWNLTVRADPPGGGTVAGGGSFLSGASVTVTAAANTNTLPYSFLNWTEYGALQSAQTNYTFTLTRDRQLVANFTLPAYSITASNQPPAAGTVSGQGTFPFGTTNVLTARPNFGYRFTHWSEAGIVVSTDNTLTTVVRSNRFVVAHYAEANVLHLVTTATAPLGLAVVAGAGTYTNGQTATLTAPLRVTNPPSLYSFREFRLNGVFAGNDASFSKTFSTLDPTNLEYVAHYDSASLRPLVVNTFVSHANPVPATSNFVFSLQFNRSMNPNVTPLVVLTNPTAPVQAIVPPGGAWVQRATSNDTFSTPPIAFGPGMDGTNQVWVSQAQDLAGATLAQTNLGVVIVDVTPPAHPALTLTASNSTSATVSWSDYAAAPDLSGLRVYLAQTNFSSVGGLTMLTRLASNARAYTYGGLALDTPYYAAIAAVDRAGNSPAEVRPLAFNLRATVPPPVPVQVAATGLDSAQVSWTAYNAASLLGFGGFWLFYETNDFTSVANLTPKQTLAGGTRTASVTGLDRRRAYYLAVVGFNVHRAYDPTVTTARWSDPFAGNLASDLTLGGPGQERIEVYESLTVVNNAALTLLPGTTLRFAPGAGLAVQQGRLVAHGTALDPIRFTSAQDFPGGAPAPGSWAGVTLGWGAGASVMRHVFIQYGAGLTLDDCAPTVEAFTARHNTPAGLTLLNGATLTTADALLAYNGIGARQSGPAQLSLRNSVLKHNRPNALAAGAPRLVATHNWWGSPSAAEIDATLQGPVDRSDFLTYEPLLTPALGTANNVTQVSTPLANLRLACRTAEAMRLSEDSRFIGAFFEPFANTIAFPLSEGGGQKTVFAQFRSLTGQTNAPLVLTVNYVTAGPTITAFNLGEGQALTRPYPVTGAASAPLGMAALEFYVDGALQTTAPGGSLAYWWDVRGLGSGVRRVKLLARDTANHFALLERNVFLNLTPPPPPAITVPVADLTLNTGNTVDVAGRAEPFLDVRLAREAAHLGTTTADANGAFSFAAVPLVEGRNELTATAFDALGSARSAPRTVVLDREPPAPPVLNPPLYTPAEGLFLSWRVPGGGELARRFQLFWHPTPFTDPRQASGRSSVLAVLGLNLRGLAPGAYYFGVVGLDDAGNTSALSEAVPFEYDPLPPQFTLEFDKPSPVNAGPLRVALRAAEPLRGQPSLTLRFAGGPPLLLPVTNTALLTYESTLNVTPFTPSGPVQWNVSAQDLAGNVFNGPPEGAALAIDVQAPSGRIATVPAGLIQVTNPVAVAVQLVLSEPAKTGTTPSLSFNPPAGAGVPIALGGASSNWTGTLTLTPGMGSGVGGFVLEARDELDNVGHLVAAGGTLEIYDTPLPAPPPAPTGLQVTSLAGGQIALAWNPAPNADSYRVYAEPGTEAAPPTVLIADNLTATAHTDLPPADGYYRYVVAASRRGAEGPGSGVRVIASDRTPPPAPTGLAAQLLLAGVQLGWQRGAGEVPREFRLYRNGALLRTVGNNVNSFLDAPPRGTSTYTVTALDGVGNEASSEPASIALLVSAVNHLQVFVDAGQAPQLTWTSDDPAAVGFNIYRNGIRQNTAPLASLAFVDPLPQGTDLVTYAVRAVNATNAESAARSVPVYAVDFGLSVNTAGGPTNHPPLTHYFDEFRVTVSNRTANAAFPLREVELRRSVPGLAPLSYLTPVNLRLAAGSRLEQAVVFPSSANLNAQSLRARAVQQTDLEGSSVVYGRVFEFPEVTSSGATIELVANAAPLAGGLASFDVRILNPSYTPIDVVVARESGARPGDLYVAVRNTLGQEVSRTEFNAAPPGTLGAPDGRAFVRIAPRSSTTLTMTNVLVPVALGTNATLFEAVIPDIYHGLGTGTERRAGPLSGAMVSSLLETPYYGTAQTDRQLYANDEPVLISGQALDRVTRQAQPNVPLKIGFFTRGYRFYRDVTTDASGAYQYVFNPPPGLGATMKLWAAHPAVFDVLNQAEVRISRLYASPARAEVRMSKNDTLPFSISLLNPGDDTLSGFSYQFQAWQMQDTNRVAITNLTGAWPDAAGFTLGPRANQRINLALNATLDAPDHALVEFSFHSAEGATATLSGTVTLLPAVPVLAVTDPATGYVEVSVNRGDLRSRSITFANRGLGALTGVTLTPPTNVNWMRVSLPAGEDGLIHLPELAPGGSESFVVAFAPPEGTPLEFHQDSLTVQGTNSPAQLRVNLYALVTSNQRGAVQFFVDSILTYPVPNATLRIKNTILGAEHTAQTDANGYVTIGDLQEGDWAWQANAPGHSATVGVVKIVPDQTVEVRTRLSRSLVTVNFTVEPVPFTDRYEIKIEQTFETHVPAPMLVVEPTMTRFDNVGPGFETTFIALVRNPGLIQLNDLRIGGAEVSGATLTPLITYVPVLLPQQTLEVPYRAAYAGTATGPGVGPRRGVSQHSGGFNAAAFADCATGGLVGLANAVTDLAAIGNYIDTIATMSGLNADGQCADGQASLQVAAVLLVSYSLLAAPSFSPLGFIPTGLPAVSWPIMFVVGLINCTVQQFIGPAQGGGGAGIQGLTAGPGIPTATGYGVSGPVCFAAGTTVLLAAGTWQPIEGIKVGDWVRTGCSTAQRASVRQVIKRTSDELHEIRFRPTRAHATERAVSATGDHLFWVDGLGWTQARALLAGQWLLGSTGQPAEILSRQRLPGLHTVYSLVLVEDSAFFANDVLVHDWCGVPWPQALGAPERPLPQSPAPTR